MEPTSTILIKGMVCPRCVRVVKEDLVKEGYIIEDIELGKVVVSGQFNKSNVRGILEKAGFGLVEDQEEKQVEAIKALILNLLENEYFKNSRLKNSVLIEEQLNESYDKLSRTFSAFTGSTIEHYIIEQKINKAKEYFKYSAQSIEQIAFLLGYSSVAHLSRQFKEVTGLTPTQFRNQFQVG